MNCAYHAHNPAVVNCNGCGKPLCPGCDHRIKGFPYCQDCIVSGVELLRNQRASNHAPFVKRQTSPIVSTILSFVCPGLGAAYNGQTSKAIVHFGAFVGFFQLAIASGSPVFVFGFLGMWLYSAVDAYKTAKLIRQGLTPDGAEDIIFRRVSGNPKVWGIVLTALGALFFLQMFFNLRNLIRAALPVMLIGLGIYLLTNYLSKKKVEKVTDFSSAPAYLAGETAFRTGGYAPQEEFETQVRNWRSR
jgi:hypothetical protein